MKKKLSVMLIVAIIIFVGVNCDKLYAAFSNRFTKEIQSQACVLDFDVMGDFSSREFVDVGENTNFDSNNEVFIPINFDVKNSGDCEIYIRAAIYPIIEDKLDSNQVYKLEKSSCEIQYCNKDGINNLDEKYWEKSSDGYYCYKSTLTNGETLKNKLVSGIKLKLSKQEAMDFSDKRVKIVAVIEARQNRFN